MRRSPPPDFDPFDPKCISAKPASAQERRRRDLNAGIKVFNLVHHDRVVEASQKWSKMMNASVAAHRSAKWSSTKKPESQS